MRFQKLLRHQEVSSEGDKLQGELRKRPARLLIQRNCGCVSQEEVIKDKAVIVSLVS